MTLLRNERGRFLDDWLVEATRAADEMVLLDNGSDDGTYEALVEQLPHAQLKRDGRDFAADEPALRERLWEMARKVARPGDWVLSLDADEFLTEGLHAVRDELGRAAGGIAVRLCDMWSPTHFRVDGMWSPAGMPILFEFRDEPWGHPPARGLHRPRLPAYAGRLRWRNVPAQMRHRGWERDELRRAKHAYYMARSEGTNLDHARTIMDAPTLEPLEQCSRKIVVASLVRNREKEMPTFLESLSRIHYPGLRFRFLVNDSTDGAEGIVREWCAGRDAVVEARSYGAGSYREHVWHDEKGSVFERMAAMRDDVLGAVFAGDADACFMLDSDVLLHPDVLQHVAGLARSVVSPVFLAAWGADSAWRNVAQPVGQVPGALRRDRFVNTQLAAGRRPQCGDRAGYELRGAEIGWMLSSAGVHQCGSLGACTLIRRDVWEAGARYTKDPQNASPFPGEDQNFCLQARARGFQLWCSTVYPTWHWDAPEIVDHWRQCFA